MQIGIPEHAVLPGLMDSALLVLVALCSLTSHTFIARAFQVENAGKCAAAGYLQVPPLLSQNPTPHCGEGIGFEGQMMVRSISYFSGIVPYFATS